MIAFNKFVKIIHFQINSNFERVKTNRSERVELRDSKRADGQSQLTHVCSAKQVFTKFNLYLYDASAT